MEACPNLAEISDEGFLRAFSEKSEAQGIALSASIELTERCNLGCIHCYLGDQKALHKERNRELSTEQWFNILDQLTELGCLQLLITGGDPLMRRDFVEVYKHAKQCGLLVTVFTNGTLINDEIIELFRELPPYAVEISLYGVTAETYEKITGVPGSFARCMTGIEQLKALGVELGLKTIAMQPNKHELHQIAEVARQFGTRKFRLDIEIQNSFDGNDGLLALRLPPDEGVRLEQECSELAKNWTDFVDRRKDLPPLKTDKLYNCGAAKNALHVSPYGMLQPCLSVRNISYNLLHGTLEHGIKTIRRELSTKTISTSSHCNECQDRLVCSACPAFALQEDGGVEDQPAEYQCRVTKLRRQFVESEKDKTDEK